MQGAPTRSGTGDRQPVLRAVGWSIAVVFLGSVSALAVTPADSGQDLEAAGALGPAVDAAGGLAEAGPLAPGASVAETAATTTSAAPAPAAPAPTASTAKKATSPTTAAAAAAKAKAKAPPPAAAAAPAPALRLQPDAGSYPLRVTGTSAVDGKSASLPSSATLVVQQRGGTDQVQRTDGLPGGLVITQRATPSGLDLLAFSLSASGRTLTFSPPSPLPFVRTDAPVGTSWSWTARSTDGSVSVSQTATVTSVGPVSVAGASIPAVTVSRVLTASGAVQGTLQLISTVSQADRLPLVQRQVLDVRATFLGLFSTHIVSDITATLTSTRPR